MAVISYTPFLPGPRLINGTDLNTQFNYPKLASETSITAFAGGGKASAYQLTAMLNRVTTVATAADSVKLPAAMPGLDVVLINAGANAMQVFGQGSDTINGVATGTGVSHGAGITAGYRCFTAGAWIASGVGTSSGSSTVFANTGLQILDTGGDNTTTIKQNSDEAANRTLNIPALGGNDTIMTLAVAQTVTAAKTFSVMPIIPTATVAATGSTQTDAAPITTGFTLVSAADGTKGVKLPTAVAGLQCIIKNNVAATLKVWPFSGDAINAIAADSSMSLANLVSAVFTAYDATTWYTTPLLPS